MEISKFDTAEKSREGVWIVLTDLSTGKKSDARIKILGMDSEAFDEAKTDQAREMADHVEAGNKVTPAFRRECTCRLLAACTVGWDGLTDGGAPLEFSRKAAFDLYMRMPAIREEVNREMGDRANFVAA
jgi:hypothetical protein